MACINCDSNPINIPGPIAIYSTSCTDCDGCEDVKNLCYQGPNLSCSNIYTGNKLDVVIQKLDSKLCAVLGDYSMFDTGCLTQEDGSPILNQEQFVASASSAICETRGVVEEFIGNTFEQYKDDVDTRFKVLEFPAITSTAQGIVDTDTQKEVLTKLAANIDGIIGTKLNLSSVEWDQCFTVTTTPTTIAAGFNTLVDQICLLKDEMVDAGVTLPTFNNVGSTLPSPTTADTLVATIGKIKTRVDQIPTFDINALTWGCTTKPSTSAYNLQAAFQSVLTGVNDYKQNKLTFSGDFVVTQTSGSDACAGKTISLATSAVADRRVASNDTDTTPGTLASKLQQGTGITIDSTSVAGKIIINSTATGADVKVKVNTSDATGGFLEDKIEGSTTNGITVTKSITGGNSKVTLGTSIDAAALWTYLLTFLDSHPSTYAEFCERVSDCLPDCIIPPHVTAIYNPSLSTTTTTTTTTIV